MSTSPSTITVYGKPECTDTLRARALLDARDEQYVYVDVQNDETQRDRARELSGVANVPVIVFPSGAVLIEPSDDELTSALST